MFPEFLDNAEVLYHTLIGDFGTIKYVAGDIFDDIKYLAICKYANDGNACYLFQVNRHYEVIGDCLFDSVDDCMNAANSTYGGNILWIKTD